MTGSKQYITILCAFADVSTVPHPQSYYNTLMTGAYPSMDTYWREVSYNTINLTGSVTTRWYTLPQPKSYYVYGSTPQFDLTRAANDCTSVADGDVYFPSFYGVNLIFNDAVPGSAWGTSGHLLSFDGVSHYYGMTWLPTPSTYQQPAVWAHEMGHSLGLAHSAGPTGKEYDSSWDNMANNWSHCDRETDPTYGCLGAHIIAFDKDLLGWISPAQKFTYAGVNRTITINQLTDNSTGNYLMAVIPHDSSGTKYTTVEMRHQTGYDIKLPANAVIIHDVDTTRNNPAWVQGTDGDTGAIFGSNRTYSVPGTTVTISILTLNATNATVTIGQPSLPPPTAASINPAYGQTTGGTRVTIRGTNFSPSATVTFDGTAAPSITYVDSTTLVVTTPPQVFPEIVFQITITNPDGHSATLYNSYTYTSTYDPYIDTVNPKSGPSAGGTFVAIYGGFISYATGATFGGVPAINFGSNAQGVSAGGTTPPHAPGKVDVVVTMPDGRTATLSSAFTYLGSPPTISTVFPGSGKTSGGTLVVISGTNFQAGATVSFGGEVATQVTVNSASSLSAILPDHIPGVVDVTVTNADGQQATLPQSFVYAAPVVDIRTQATISDAVGGNNNGVIDPGETIALTIALTNMGDTLMTGLSGTLTTTNSAITVLNGTSLYSDIGVGAATTNTTPYRFSTSASLPCDSQIQFTQSVTFAEQSYPLTISLPAFACGPALPDLQPYAPVGYTAPIVPSSTLDAHAPNTLYAGQTTYLDFAFANFSTADAGSFQVEVWLDNIRVIRNTIPSLQGGYYYNIANQAITVPTGGLHTLKLIVDADSTVAESDETNNQWQGQFTWTVLPTNPLPPRQPDGPTVGVPSAVPGARPTGPSIPGTKPNPLPPPR